MNGGRYCRRKVRLRWKRELEGRFSLGWESLTSKMLTGKPGIVWGRIGRWSATCGSNVVLGTGVLGSLRELEEVSRSLVWIDKATAADVARPGSGAPRSFGFIWSCG
jgi:hypothetical protein